jgi:hypothetical protein
MMETQEKYLMQLNHAKWDLQNVDRELKDIMQSLENGDVEYAFERAFEHLVDKAQQATQALSKSRRLMREVAEELAELEEASQ